MWPCVLDYDTKSCFTGSHLHFPPSVGCVCPQESLHTPGIGSISPLVQPEFHIEEGPVFQRGWGCLQLFSQAAQAPRRGAKVKPCLCTQGWEVLFSSRLCHPNHSGIPEGDGSRTFPVWGAQHHFRHCRHCSGRSWEEFSLWEKPEQTLVCVSIPLQTYIPPIPIPQLILYSQCLCTSGNY